MASKNGGEDDNILLGKFKKLTTSGIKECNLSEQLNKFIDSLDVKDRDATLSTLMKIFNNIIQFPYDDKYRRIKIANRRFSNDVWQYPAGKELMNMSGWIVEDDSVRLTDESCIQTVSQLLKMSEIREQLVRTNKKPYSDAMNEGNAPKLRSLLNQAGVPACSIIIEGWSLLSLALAYNELGIARILITEYSMDVNIVYDSQGPSVFKLIQGGATDKTIIEFTKEFDVNVNVITEDGFSFLNYALLYKCFDVVQYLVEDKKVDINASINFLMSSKCTTLHIAYAINESDIADYLIKHGANKDAIDIHGKKPIDYDGGNTILEGKSEFYANQRKIHRNRSSTDYKTYIQLVEQGYSIQAAVSIIVENWKHNKTPSWRNLDTTPTLNDLNRYIIDIAPSYYAVGLELDIVNRQLKLINSDPSLPDLKEKCRAMLQVWLETDSSATWKKLCDALEEVDLMVIAERMKCL